EGALASGTGFPRIEVEVLRVDERSEGIADIASVPRARATDVGFVARAWIRRGSDAPIERDTGDVHAMDVVGVDSQGRAGLDARKDALGHEGALRAIARRVGRKLASRILGRPVPNDEGAVRDP